MAKLTCNFISYTLKRAVDITIIMPSVTLPNCNEKATHSHKPYPVLYLLHGYGNNHATWNGYTRVELYAEERNIAVVMMSADNKAYINHGGDDNYFDFMNECIEFVESNFKVSKKKEDRYIAGLSMGGYGALVHGLLNPDKYQAIGVLSGLVAPQNKKMIQPSKLLKTNIENNIEIPNIYLTIGNNDFLLEMNQKFVRLLNKLKVNCTTEFIDDYAHEWRFWDIKIEEFLDWIPRSDVFANERNRV